MLFAQRRTFLSLMVGALVMVSSAVGETGGKNLWSTFETTRNGPLALHQEFDVEQHAGSSYAQHVQHYQLVVDFAQGKWREQMIGGNGDRIQLFDGQDLYTFEPGGTEYTRKKQSGNKDEQLPAPFENRLDWGKAKEVQRGPCGFAGKDHTCVIVDVPIKPWLRPTTPGDVATMTGGTSRVMIDTETGIWLRCDISAVVDNSGFPVQWDLTYTIKQMSYGAIPDANLFKVPEGMQEVKQLTPWDDAQIKKQLAGKPAPDMTVTDLQGNPVSLASLKGKTVLLDFWTTWCPPCQADASLDKLNQKYGNKSLAIVGISVSEDRETVVNYLQKHPHHYPIVLSTENRLPRPYEIHIFPTYMIIDPDGKLTTAEQGDQGFGKLRKDLKKAGLDVE